MLKVFWQLPLRFFITLRRSGSAGRVLGAQPAECHTALTCVFFRGQAGADREAGSFTFLFDISKLHRRKVVT